MKFNINKNELLKVLSITGFFAGTNSTMPVLESIKFGFIEQHNLITLETSSLDASILIDLNMEGLEDKFKPFTVNHKELMDLIKLIDYDVLNFSVEKHTLTITTPFLDEYSLASGDVEEFPVTNYTYDDEHVLHMSTGMMQTIVDEMKLFCGNDDLRPVMSAMYFQSDESTLIITATDAHKLYNKKYYDYIENGAKIEFLLPNHKALRSFGGDNITIGTNENNIIIVGEGYVMAFTAVQGKYPNYKAVIPAINEDQYALEIDTAPFRKNLKIASIMTDSASKVVVIEKNEKEFTLTGENIDLNRKSKGNIVGSCKTDMRTGYNGVFLSEIMSIVSGESFTMHGESNRAQVIRESVDENKIDKLMLLMPTMLNDGKST